MNRSRTFKQGLMLSIVVFGFVLAGQHGVAVYASTEDAELTPDAIPFTLTIKPLTYGADVKALPGVQSVVIASRNGKWLLLGGRTQGLHTFFPAPRNNFPVKQANKFIRVIDPATGEHWNLDLSKLPANLADPLTATNQPAHYDRQEDLLYVAGGYGWDSAVDDMNTFDSLISIPVEDTINLIMSPLPETEKLKALEGYLRQSRDERFAVTGGELRRLNGRFYLVFGQYFKGDYHAFGSGAQGGRPQFVQKYTEQVRVFTLKPGTLEILSYGPLVSSDPSKPFHRRDGVIIDDIDPKNGVARVSAYGGVFKPGKTTGFGEPIFIDDNNGAPSARVDNRVVQKFSQYQSPVVSVYDDTSQVIYHTFYGGLSEHYFHQTKQQKAVLDLVVDQFRADGVPFIADVTTLVQNANGDYKQFILPDPIPAVDAPESVTRSQPPPYKQYDTSQAGLFGTSANFILDPALIESGHAYENGVVKLSAFDGKEKVVLGHFYGGIAAFFPYALVPNTGTYASNTVFEISLEPLPTAAYSAEYGLRAAANHRGGR